MGVERMRVELVGEMPEALENGVLYVSERYRLALHSCCCGCGEEVSTPLGRTEYTLQDDGDGVTLHPSIGNHDFACRSHYLIQRGRVVWAGAMSRAAIERGRKRDRRLKRARRPRGVRAIVARLWRSLPGLFR